MNDVSYFNYRRRKLEIQKTNSSDRLLSFEFYFTTIT